MSCDHKTCLVTITRAPEVRLTRRLVHSAYFFKTKSSSILLMLKSSQITVFCNFNEFNKNTKNVIFQDRGRPQGNIYKKENRDFPRSRPPAGQHQQKGKPWFFKIEVGAFQNRPPDRIWGHFLYHSELFWPVCFTGSLQIVREARNFAKIGKNIFWKFQIWGPNINTKDY